MEGVLAAQKHTFNLAASFQYMGIGNGTVKHAYHSQNQCIQTPWWALGSNFGLQVRVLCICQECHMVDVIIVLEIITQSKDFISM